MGIIKNNLSVIGIFKANIPIIKVYKGNHLTWLLNLEIPCCFSNGYWIDEYPWVDDTYWSAYTD